jgi:hypothetical protein
MMNYEEFKDAVLDNIKDYLSEEYSDFDMECIDVNKTGYTYEGLIIGAKESGIQAVPVLNITEAFAHYRNGGDFDNIMTCMAKLRMEAAAPEVNKSDILDYDKISQYIQPRLINTSNNEEYLADKPHREVEDLSVTYVVRFEYADGLSDAIITDDLVNYWGITVEELNAKAMGNLAKKSPKFADIVAMVSHEPCDIDLDELNPDDYPAPMFVLSNPQITYGAVMALNSSVMDKIIEKFGDVYVIPSSVDEVIIIPKFMSNDIEYLRATVGLVNQCSVSPESRLSNHIYDYCEEGHKLSMLA